MSELSVDVARARCGVSESKKLKASMSGSRRVRSAMWLSYARLMTR